MKRSIFTVLSICLILGLANLAIAQDYLDSLMNSGVFECVYPDPVSNLDPEEFHTFSVTWDKVLDKSDRQTKFVVGSAKFGVFDLIQTLDGGETKTRGHKTIDVPLWKPKAPDYIFGETPGYFFYSCPRNSDGVCTGELVGFAEAINNKLAAIYGGSPEDFSWGSATFLGIFFRISVRENGEKQTHDLEVCGLYEEGETLAGSSTDGTLTGSNTGDSIAGSNTEGTGTDSTTSTPDTDQTAGDIVEDTSLPNAEGDSSNSTCNDNVLWYADHETGDYSQWSEWKSGWNTGNASQKAVNSQAHTGNYSLQMTIDTSNGVAAVRLPVRVVGDGPSILPDSAYYSVWYRLPPNVDREITWNVMDWKTAYYRPDGRAWSDNAYNILAKLNGDGTYSFQLYDKIGPNGIYGNYGVIATSSSKFNANEWVQIECLYEWSVNPDGRITCYQDGKQMWDMKNIRTQFDYDLHPLPRQWKVNHYSSGLIPDKVTIHIDDAAVSSTRLGPNCSPSDNVR